MKPILECAAFELAEQIQSKKRTSLEIVEAHISAIKICNPKLNALVEDNFIRARSQAKAADEKIHSHKDEDGPLPALLGVPFTIKEMIAVQGFRHTLGSIHRKNEIATENSAVYKKLTHAGAILLGTTNVPELGFWFESENVVYGKTSNPYDLSRTSGGSSGGEAALIGAGASAFGIGSDIGGSLRMPAGFCGIFAHKPSRRLIPMTGHFPIYEHNATEWTGDNYPLTVIGPLARKATDLYPLMQILIGPDGFDSEIRNDFWLEPKISDWKGKTVWILPSPLMTGQYKTNTEMSDAVKTAGRYFEALGAELKILKHDLFRDTLKFWFAKVGLSKKRSFVKTMIDGHNLSILKELLALSISKNRYTLPALGASLLEILSKSAQPKLESQQQLTLCELAQLKSDLNSLLGQNSILIMPNHPQQAFKHRASYLRPFDFAMTGIANALEFPATTAVIGMKNELPLAVQILAGEFQDHLTISAAEVLESAFGGWTPPAQS